MGGKDGRLPQEQATAHPMRVAILDLLAEHRDAGLSAPVIYHELPDGPSLSTVTYHLRVLADAGLVKVDRVEAAPVYARA